MNKINTATYQHNAQKNNQQKGVALIGVLIIVALITASYTFLLQKQSSLFESTKLGLEQGKVFNYFYSIQSWAKSEIKKNFKDTKQPYDSLDEDWATQIPPLPVPGGYIEGQLFDRSSKLNINQILVIKKNRAKIKSTPDFNGCFVRLTNALDIEHLDDFILDYINQQNKKTLFKDISELKKVPGITNKYYQKIKPYLYAANYTTKININTASQNILRCLHSDITDFIAKKIKKQIKKRPIKTQAELKSLFKNELPHLTDEEIKEFILKLVDIKTSYFELNSTIKMGDTTFKAKSVLFYKSGKITNYFRIFDYQL